MKTAFYFCQKIGLEKIGLRPISSYSNRKVHTNSRSLLCAFITVFCHNFPPGNVQYHRITENPTTHNFFAHFCGSSKLQRFSMVFGCSICQWLPLYPLNMNFLGAKSIGSSSAALTKKSVDLGSTTIYKARAWV